MRRLRRKRPLWVRGLLIGLGAVGIGCLVCAACIQTAASVVWPEPEPLRRRRGGER